MILFVLAYLGGVLTIVSPCILPVLPFVFARAGRPFVTSTLPMLFGMVLTFAAVASLAAVGGGWAVQANEYGRYIAMAVLAVFGVILLAPSLSTRLTQPLVNLGSRLSNTADHQGGGIVPSLLLGVATGLLWAPCAGPILGLILTGAALNGASIQTSLLLAAYALGAATSLALALLVGGKVFATMKRGLGVGEWVRKVLGVAVLAGVVAIGLGLDTGVLSQLSTASTASLEQGLVDRFRGNAPAPSVVASNGPAMMRASTTPGAAEDLPIEDDMPSLGGANQWLNSPPLTVDSLKGKVVLVDFWTYSCINCLRAIPYVEAWAKKYRDQGLVVIGVHAPEFAFERNVDNVKKAVTDLGIDYPVAIDNDYAIWRGFHNQYWPAHYFIDANGEIRHHHFGEGNYADSERVIQKLLAEAGHKVSSDIVAVSAAGAQAAADTKDVQSPETYVGYARAENFASLGGEIHGAAHDYSLPSPGPNRWGLAGNWTVDGEKGTLNQPGGQIVYRFHARDLHLVLGTAVDAGPVHYQVTIDGQPPGDSHGADTDAKGEGVVTGQRLYQLVRQTGPVMDHIFEIRFLDGGVQAYSFTFG